MENQRTIQITKITNTRYHYKSPTGYENNVTECQLVALLASQLMQTIIDHFEPNDDGEIVLIRYPKPLV